MNKNFKQPQEPFQNVGKNNLQNETVESSDMMPISRTRFSRALRSPLKFDANIDGLPVVECQQNIISEENFGQTFPEKGTGVKSSIGDKNRCRTCKKVSRTRVRMAVKNYLVSVFCNYVPYIKKFGRDDMIKHTNRTHKLQTNNLYCLMNLFAYGIMILLNETKIYRSAVCRCNRFQRSSGAF